MNDNLSVWDESLTDQWTQSATATDARQAKAESDDALAQRLTKKLQGKYRSEKEANMPFNKDYVSAAKVLYQMNQGKEWDGDDQGIASYGIEEVGRYKNSLFQADTPSWWPVPVVGDRPYMDSQDELGMIGYMQKMLSPETTDNQKLAFIHLVESDEAMDAKNWKELGRTGNAMVGDLSNMLGFGTLIAAGVKWAGKKAGKDLLMDKIKQSLKMSALGAADAGIFTGTFSSLNQHTRLAALDTQYTDSPEYSLTEDAINTGVGATIGAILPATPSMVKGVWNGLGKAVDKTYKHGQLNTGIGLTDSSIVDGASLDGVPLESRTPPVQTGDGIDVYHGTSSEFGESLMVLDKQTGKPYIVKDMQHPVIKRNPERFEIINENELGHFDPSQSGSGDGAAAFGEGTYVADDPDVARQYRGQQVRRAGLSDDIKVGDQDVLELYGQMENSRQYDKMEALERLMLDGDALEIVADINIGESSFEPHIQEWFMENIAPNIKREGSLYHAKLNASSDNLLNWDKSLTEQSIVVKQALKKHQGVIDKYLGKRNETRFRINPEKPPLTEDDIDGQDIYLAIMSTMGDQTAGNKELQAQASKALDNLGISGIQFFVDRGAKSGGRGAKNYVVFDPRSLEIISKYSLTGLAAGLSVMNKNEEI